MAAAYNGSSSRPIVAIAALAAERRTLRDAATHAPGGRIGCTQCGPGATRALAAARAAIDRGAKALISWGFAGALVPGLDAGTLLLPRRVCDTDGRSFASDPRWLDAVRGAVGSHVVLADGDLLSVSAPLAGITAKREAAEAFHACGVDMESAAIFEAASRAGLPALALRVVIDRFEDALPDDAALWIDARGNMRIGRALAALAAPSEWRMLLALSRRLRAARASLQALADELAPRDFVFPES